MGVFSFRILGVPEKRCLIDKWHKESNKRMAEQALERTGRPRVLHC